MMPPVARKRVKVMPSAKPVRTPTITSSHCFQTSSRNSYVIQFRRFDADSTKFAGGGLTSFTAELYKDVGTLDNQSPVMDFHGQVAKGTRLDTADGDEKNEIVTTLSVSVATSRELQLLFAYKTLDHFKDLFQERAILMTHIEYTVICPTEDGETDVWFTNVLNIVFRHFRRMPTVRKVPVDDTVFLYGSYMASFTSDSLLSRDAIA